VRMSEQLAREPRSTVLFSVAEAAPVVRHISTMFVTFCRLPLIHPLAAIVAGRTASGVLLRAREVAARNSSVSTTA
jgi:hypothetical protein